MAEWRQRNSRARDSSSLLAKLSSSRTASQRLTSPSQHPSCHILISLFYRQHSQQIVLLNCAWWGDTRCSSDSSLGVNKHSRKSQTTDSFHHSSGRKAIMNAKEESLRKKLFWLAPDEDVEDDVHLLQLFFISRAVKIHREVLFSFLINKKWNFHEQSKQNKTKSHTVAEFQLKKNIFCETRETYFCWGLQKLTGLHFVCGKLLGRESQSSFIEIVRIYRTTN